MKYAAKNYFFISLLAGCFLAPSAVLHAQGKYLKQAAQKAAAKAAAGELSSTQQLFLKENQLLALQQVRRELIRTPGIMQDKAFTTQLDLLKQMGIKVPPNADEKTLFNILSNHITPLSQQTQRLVFPLSFPLQPSETKPILLRDNTHIERFQESFLNGHKQFSWQNPNHQLIYMGPTNFPKNPQHPLYACGELAQRISKGKYASLSQVFDKIFNSNLTAPQKLALARHLAKTAELAGPDLTLLYINMIKEMPAAKMEGWVPAPLGKELLTYLRHKEALLIERLKNGKTWTENETNLFLDLASFLPAEESRLMLGALTHLDLSSAQQLLLNPQNAALKKATQTRIAQAQTGGKIANSLLKDHADAHVMQAHIQLLRSWDTAYTDILNNIKQRIGAIEFLQQQETNTPSAVTNTELAFAQKLYVQAYYTRLKKLQGLVWKHLENIEAELNSLQTLSPKIEE